MSTGEYIATFASILVGLAMADLATSLHRLIRARAGIGWDWLPLAAAMLVLLAIVQWWWKRYAVWTGAASYSFAAFLPDLLSMLLMFLLAAAALPDEVPKGKLDMRSYYLDNRRYFWGLYFLWVTLATITRTARRTDNFDAPLLEMIVTNWANLILMALMALLMFTRRPWIHGTVILLMLAFSTYGWLGLSVGRPGGP